MWRPGQNTTKGVTQPMPLELDADADATVIACYGPARDDAHYDPDIGPTDQLGDGQVILGVENPASQGTIGFLYAADAEGNEVIVHLNGPMFGDIVQAAAKYGSMVGGW